MKRAQSQRGPICNCTPDTPQTVQLALSAGVTEITTAIVLLRMMEVGGWLNPEMGLGWWRA